MSVPEDSSSLRVEEGRAPTRVRSCSAPSSETAAEGLTDDLLLEILPRVPAKSLCHFRCVSKHWRSLIDHPDLRKKLPRTFAGFLYSTTSTMNLVVETFLQSPVLLATVPGSLCPLISTSLDFLPSHQRLDVLDCCNGLLLCRWYGVSAQIGEFNYVVCNPATEEWVALPDSSHGYRVSMTRLGFDPAQSSHFHVFELFEDLHMCPDPGRFGAAVHSSETGRWVHEKFNQPFELPYRYSEETVFVNSRLHFHVSGYDGENPTKGIAAVDTEVGTWTNFGVPADDNHLGAFIQWSQGRMHYFTFCKDEGNVRLKVYVLQNYESKEWTLKHNVAPFYIFGELDATFKWDLELVGIHPECNLIFFTRGDDRDTKLMCYYMDFEQVKAVCSLKDGKPPYLSYVPLYMELQSLHM
ncbi:unnamed protein product [Alopecurus aequalis]